MDDEQQTPHLSVLILLLLCVLVLYIRLSSYTKCCTALAFGNQPGVAVSVIPYVEVEV
jgi:hypothetical protein